VESSVQEPSLAAAKGMLGLQRYLHLVTFDLPEVTLSLYLHIIQLLYVIPILYC